jgi:hypothetical protein
LHKFYTWMSYQIYLMILVGACELYHFHIHKHSRMTFGLEVPVSKVRKT